MVNLDLSLEEYVLLRELLQAQLSELRMEIAGTDSYDYRERLHRRKAVLMKVLESMGTRPALSSE